MSEKPRREIVVDFGSVKLNSGDRLEIQFGDALVFCMERSTNPNKDEYVIQMKQSGLAVIDGKDLVRILKQAIGFIQ